MTKNIKDTIREWPDEVSCPYCGSYNVATTTIIEDELEAEYRCDDCGDHFIDAYP